MSSPFAVFRKHQKILLVVLVGLSMLSFVIFDAIQNVSSMGEMPPQLIVLTLAALVGAVAWVVGITNHKSNEYGVFGLIVGAALGLLFVMQGRKGDVAVTASEFTLAQSDLRALLRTRSLANSFIAQAIHETHPNTPPEQLSFLAHMTQFGFGLAQDRIEQDVVVGELLRREAAKVGLSLPDSAVQEFITLITQGNLTRETFRKIRSQIGVSERELLEALRKELLAREAAELFYPRVSLPPAVEWEFSKRLQVRQNATVAAVPVSAFIDPEAKPSPAELEKLFLAYRENFPGFDRAGRRVEGLPGFHQPPRIRMAYLTPDYLAFERQVEPTLTEEMILARYERDYVAPAKAKTGTEPFIPEAPLPPLPGPQLTPPPVKAPGEAPATPPADTAPPPSPTPSSTPSTPETPPPESERSSPDSPEETPPKDSSECDDPSSSGAPAAPEAEAPVRADVTPDAPEKSTPPTLPAPGAPEVPPPLPESSVPPLDDQLKAEIRDQLLMELTHQAIERALSEALDEVRNRIGRYVNAPAGVEQKLTLEQASQRAREYAAAHHLIYAETGELSQQELLRSEDHPVGGYSKPQPDNPFAAITVAEELFSTPPDYIFRPALVEERDAGGRVKDRAVYWKLEHKPPYVPESLADERVRQQVERTWRELAAREKAERRARELAEKARQSGRPLLEALGSESVTGAPNSPPLNILQTGQFSWMRQNIVPSMDFRRIEYVPVLSQIPGLEPLGEDFMRIVFDELQPGDVGVAPSVERTVYYVVRIDSRIPADEEQWNIVRNNYLSGAYEQAQQRMAADLVMAEIPDWRNELFRKYQVELHTVGSGQ